MILTDKQLYIGFDLDNSYSQITYYVMGMKQPQSISPIVGGDNYLIPTVMLRKNNGQWVYGDDAITGKEKSEGVFIDNILEHALKDDSFEIDGENFSFFSCLEQFVKKVLKLAYIASGASDSRRKIVFTTRNLDSNMVNLLDRLSASINQGKDTVLYQSHKDSIFHYIIFQKEELWLKDVCLFDYGRDNFNYYRLRTKRNTKPCIVYIEEKTKPDMIDMPVEKRDNEFLSIVNDTFGTGDVVSCVYLTGVSYNEKWLDKSLKTICRNRRAFIGQNLFTEGACYKAISSEEERHDYMYLGEAKMQVNVGIHALEDGEERYISIMEAGGNWYDTQCTADVILNNTNRVEFVIESLSGEMRTTRSFELIGLPNRPPKTTRIRINLKPMAVDKIKVSMEDMGFGEMFRRSGKIWNFIMEY